MAHQFFEGYLLKEDGGKLSELLQESATGSAHATFQVVGGTGGIRTASVAKRYPVTSGLIAGTTKTEGRITNLVPAEGSNTSKRLRKGL